jgi:hypothetical protein
MVLTGKNHSTGEQRSNSPNKATLMRRTFRAKQPHECTDSEPIFPQAFSRRIHSAVPTHPTLGNPGMPLRFPHLSMLLPGPHALRRARGNHTTTLTSPATPPVQNPASLLWTSFGQHRQPGRGMPSHPRIPGRERCSAIQVPKRDKDLGASHMLNWACRPASAPHREIPHDSPQSATAGPARR